MRAEEIDKLVKYLKKLRKEKLVPPKMPYPVWLELAKIFPLAAVEVLITTDGKDFLLTERDDEYWNGWHIPGGFILAKETFAQACSRLALKELLVKTYFQYISGVYVWNKHPFGAPISIVCVCKTKESQQVGKYFTEIPNSAIEFHKTFIEDFLLGKRLD